jgi:hypothetical protein
MNAIEARANAEHIPLNDGESMTDKNADWLRYEIVAIMKEYDRQMEDRGYVDTPGGLEHMGDVWSLLEGWRKLILAEATSEGNP